MGGCVSRQSCPFFLDKILDCSLLLWIHVIPSIVYCCWAGLDCSFCLLHIGHSIFRPCAALPVVTKRLSPSCYPVGQGLRAWCGSCQQSSAGLGHRLWQWRCMHAPKDTGNPGVATVVGRPVDFSWGFITLVMTSLQQLCFPSTVFPRVFLRFWVLHIRSLSTETRGFISLVGLVG